MKLKKIRLSGFKSFVDNTEIEINEDLVAIVGPNGCGKSNLVDAIKWVLGESSARQLRGGSLVDVIFNGSLKRKAVSRAMVELIFDNNPEAITNQHNQWLQGSEIAVKRVLTRDAVSTYFINSNIVRKKEVVDLFLGTGVSSRGYAIIEQGVVNRILDSKPDELRVYLDEASGISRYQERRRETLARLNNTKDNILRIEDNNTELVGQIAKLTRQSEAAVLYNQLKSQEQDLKIYANLKQQLLLQNEIDEISCNLMINEDSYRDNNRIKEQYELKLEVLLTSNQQLENHLDDLNKEFNQLRLEQAKIEEREIGRANLQQRISQDIADTHEQIIRNKQQISELEQELSCLAKLVFDNEVIQDELEDKLIEYTDKEIAALNQQSKYTNEKINLNTKILNKKHQLETVLFARDYNKNKQDDCYTRLEQLEQATEDMIRPDNIDKMRIEHKHQLDKLSKSQDQLKNNQIKYAELQVQYNQLATVRSELQLELQDLQLRAEYTAKDIAKYDVSNRNLTPIVSSVLAGIEIKPGSEVLVKTLLSNYLSLPVFTELPLPDSIEAFDIIVSQRNHNVAGAVFDLLDHVIIKDDSLSFLRYAMSGYKCVKDLSELNLADTQVVTADGHLYCDGVLSYSAYKKIESFFGLSQEYKEYTSEILVKEQRLVALDNEITLVQEALAQCNKEILAFSNEITMLSGEEKSLALKLQQVTSLAEESKRRQERENSDRLILKLELAKLQEEEDRQIEQNEALLIELEDLELVESDFLDELAIIEANAVKARQQKQDQENALHKNSLELAKIVQTRDSMVSVLKEKKTLLEQYQIKLESLELTNADELNQENILRLESLKEELRALAIRIQQEQANLNQLNSQIVIEKEDSNKLKELNTKLSEKLVKLRFRDQECRIRLNMLNEANAEYSELSHTFDDILHKYTYDLVEVTNIIEKLSQDIGSIGLVNHQAIEELSQVQERVGKLTQNLDELQAAMADLENAIKQIDNESMVIIEDTFVKINDGLAYFFKILFGGGNSSLKFVNPDDILNSGVTIMAEPLGKKNSSINLLSGGEKALAAMSFIFALFNLNPSPFCLLDEVDAPLDDANTARFCELVKHMSNNTQFVYISHNRLTMEMAKQLIGVTMQEKGVSTVINVDMVEYSA